jgi:hypothetical protein
MLIGQFQENTVFLSALITGKIENLNFLVQFVILFSWMDFDWTSRSSKGFSYYGFYNNVSIVSVIVYRKSVISWKSFGDITDTKKKLLKNADRIR